MPNVAAGQAAPHVVATAESLQEDGAPSPQAQPNAAEAPVVPKRRRLFEKQSGAADVLVQYGVDSSVAPMSPRIPVPSAARGGQRQATLSTANALTATKKLLQSSKAATKRLALAAPTAAAKAAAAPSVAAPPDGEAPPSEEHAPPSDAAPASRSDVPLVGPFKLVHRQKPPEKKEVCASRRRHQQVCLRHASCAELPVP
jgi:hypothetical protein